MPDKHVYEAILSGYLNLTLSAAEFYITILIRQAKTVRLLTEIVYVVPLSV